MGSQDGQARHPQAAMKSAFGKFITRLSPPEAFTMGPQRAYLCTTHLPHLFRGSGQDDVSLLIHFFDIYQALWRPEQFLHSIWWNASAIRN
jgi:hypothetical protein